MRQLAIFGFLVFSLSLRAQEVLVEADRIAEEKIESSRTAAVLIGDDLQKKSFSTLADILRDIAGVEVARQGSSGQTTSVFIRGARSESTLVLIDGAESNDLMSPSGGFDFSTLALENIERIEVYRGPQSVRFGGGALGGVINIITKSASPLPKTNYLLEAGSYQSGQLQLGTSTPKYSATLSARSSAGFSAASESLGNSERDGAQVQAASLRYEGLTLRYTNSRADIDVTGGVGGDDPNNTVSQSQLIAGLSGSRRFFDQKFKSTLGFYYSEVNRRSRNLPDPVRTTDSSDRFVSQNRKLQSDNELTLEDHHLLRLILQMRQETGFSESINSGISTNIGPQQKFIFAESATYLFDNENWFFDVGVRADQSSASIFSQRLSGGRYWGKGKVLLSYGTGFKWPSFYQLFSAIGDPNLRAETSSAIELSVEKKWTSVLASLCAFENKFTDLIDFDTSTSRYFNLAKAKSRGFEIQVSTSLNLALRGEISYTYLESVDELTGHRLLRRPLNSWTLKTAYNQENYELYVLYTFKGARGDLDPNSFQPFTSAAYDRWDLGSYWRISKGLKLNGKIENLLNERYEEVAGYGTAGLSFFVGLSGEL